MIKFRGKDRHTGEWHYGDYLVIPGRFGPQPSIYIAPDDLITPVGDSLYVVDAQTVGQFTGLKDKNGKEIYGGDVLDNCCGDIAVVKFGEYQINKGAPQGWYCEFADGMQSYLNTSWCDGVIGGNIYENEDLQIFVNKDENNG